MSRDTRPCAPIGRSTGDRPARSAGALATEPDGRIAVALHEAVRDLAGSGLVDVHIEHVYTVRDGRVSHLEIRGR